MNYVKFIFSLVLLQIIFFSQALFKGYVIIPHPNDYETTGVLSNDNSYLSNRKFNDHSSVYIPEINQHLNGNPYHWISTWNPYVELGRPTFQLSGFSKAYVITRLLSFIIKNPFVLYTALTIITVSLTGIFFFLFLKSLDLSPVACFVAAVGLSMGIFFSYWLTFVMFLSTVCWSVCLLWLTTHFIKKPSFAYAVGISFAVYNLLVTGYPQFVVLCAYILSVQTLVNLLRYINDLKNKIFRAISLIGLGLLGTIAALPIYADLFFTAQQSARLAASDEFFLAVLPKLKTLQDFSHFFASIVDPFWIGNPIAESYPLVFNGFSFSPLYFTLLIFSFAKKNWQQLWYWYIFSLVCLITTVWPPAYLFAVHHLGFNLSRCQLIGGAIIPTYILCAYAVDFFTQNKRSGKINKCILFSFIPIILLSILQLLNWRGNYQIFQEGYVLLSWIIVFGFALFIRTNKEFILLLLAVISVFVYSYRLILVRPADTIQVESPIVDRIRKYTDDGTRFALMGSEMAGILPANQEALLKIKSIHSYNSLSSRRYQQIVASWSDLGTRTFGRIFCYLDNPGKIASPEFRLSGVSLLLSKVDLDSDNFTQTDKINDINFYKTIENPILSLQTSGYAVGKSNQVNLLFPLDKSAFPKPILTKSFDDHIDITVQTSQQETILFLSQEYHPYWKAHSDGKTLQTVIINQFYQGVLLPQHTSEVVLKFSPFVLWAWVPHVAYGLAFTWILFSSLQRYWLSKFHLNSLKKYGNSA